MTAPALDPGLLRQRLAELEPGAVRDSSEPPILVRAPGRVNLIGEHTDYNGGYVLPVAIDLEIRICFVPTHDRSVALTRLDTGERGSFDLDDVGGPQDSWIDYVAAVASALGAAGVPTSGLRGVIASDLPISSGLSSSAALELAAAWALAVSQPPLEPMELARLAQRAENEYVGVRSGIMDQFAVAFGRADAALLLDCRSLEYRPVPLRLQEASLVVCDSHAPRDLADSAYNERRRECEAVVERLQALGEVVETLRDVDATMLDRHAAELDPVGLARAGHVLSENQRVLATVEALVGGTSLAWDACWPRAMSRCGTRTRSALRSSTCWSVSPIGRPASSAGG